MRMTTSVPKISNRQRQRNAKAAIRQAEAMMVEAAEMARTGHMAAKLLCAVLAQKGGEIVLTTGTMEQITPDMGFSVSPNGDHANEYVVRLEKQGVTTDGTDTHDDADDRSGAPTGAEDQVDEAPEGVCGTAPVA